MQRPPPEMRIFLPATRFAFEHSTRRPRWPATAAHEQAGGAGAEDEDIVGHGSSDFTGPGSPVGGMMSAPAQSAGWSGRDEQRRIVDANHGAAVINGPRCRRAKAGQAARRRVFGQGPRSQEQRGPLPGAQGDALDDGGRHQHRRGATAVRAGTDPLVARRGRRHGRPRGGRGGEHPRPHARGQAGAAGHAVVRRDRRGRSQGGHRADGNHPDHRRSRHCRAVAPAGAPEGHGHDDDRRHRSSPTSCSRSTWAIRDAICFARATCSGSRAIRR